MWYNIFIIPQNINFKGEIYLIIPKLYSIDVIQTPQDKENFLLGFTAYIGEENVEGADCFYFEVITPKKLVEIIKEKRIYNGKNLLIVEKYDLNLIEKEINRILQDCIRPTWNEVAQAINRYLAWEYDNIKNTSIEEAQQILSNLQVEE